MALRPKKSYLKTCGIIYLFDLNIVNRMKINNINVNETIESATALLDKEKNISLALRATIKVVLLLLKTMLERLSLNSKNSSKPPSGDENRKKKKTGGNGINRKPGGQPGRKGVQLKPVIDPDEIERIKIDKRKLPKDTYTEDGYEARQVMDFNVSITIKEYRAQVLIDSKGNRYVAEFPSHVTRPIQYGTKTKATSVYMSQFQLIPYKRIEDYFSEQIGINISAGSIFNFNKDAYELLEQFEAIAKLKLINSPVLNADETGINVNSKRIWLHAACNDKWTYFHPHTKRGTDAIEEMDIIPNFKGTLCHDHWKPYYTYDQCMHSLCNAHHLRELEWSEIEDKQKWAGKLSKLLVKLNRVVDAAGGKLSETKCAYYRKRYRVILSEGEKMCPAPIRERGQKGRLKKSKSRNLLERFITYENDVLRFMTDINVPFTNNQGENDLRMTKVQQKISGCFRSHEGALIFCRIRSYLITCRKHGVSATEALETLFSGKLPDFVREDSG